MLGRSRFSEARTTHHFLSLAGQKCSTRRKKISWYRYCSNFRYYLDSKRFIEKTNKKFLSIFFHLWQDNKNYFK